MILIKTGSNYFDKTLLQFNSDALTNVLVHHLKIMVVWKLSIKKCKKPWTIKGNIFKVSDFDIMLVKYKPIFVYELNHCQIMVLK